MKQIAPFRRGRPIAASHLNQIVDAVGNNGIARPRQMEFPGTDDAAQTIVVTRRLTIRSIDADHLVCAEPNDTSSPLYYVAKPDEFRSTHTAHNGITFSSITSTTRSATDGSTVEAHILTPAYVAGDAIYAEGPILGGTGVTANGLPVTWIDTNRTGRAWAVDDS